MPKKTKTEAPKNPIGRPTDYRSEFCAMLIEHMRQGGSFESFGPSVGTHRGVLYRWAKEHEEFSDAKRLGEDLSLKFYEGIGKAMGAGQLTRTITKRLKNGKEVKYTKPTQGSAAVWIFIMKNRAGWRDRVEHLGPGQGPMQMMFMDMDESAKRKNLKDIVARLSRRQKRIDGDEDAE